MLDMPADTRTQLLLSLSALVEQCTALADALGLDGAAADLRQVRADVSGVANGSMPPRD